MNISLCTIVFSSLSKLYFYNPQLNNYLCSPLKVMSYKDFFKQIAHLIISPSSTWDNLISGDSNWLKKDFEFFRSLILFNTITTFIGTFLHRGEAPVFILFLKPIFSSIAYFASFWVVYFILIEFLNKKFKLHFNRRLSVRLSVYSITLNIVINNIIILIPDLFFLRIMNLYTIYIVWEGAARLTKLDENKLSSFVLLYSSIVLIVSFIIDYALSAGLPY